MAEDNLQFGEAARRSNSSGALHAHISGSSPISTGAHYYHPSNYPHPSGSIAPPTQFREEHSIQGVPEGMASTSASYSALYDSHAALTSHSTVGPRGQNAMGVSTTDVAPKWASGGSSMISGASAMPPHGSVAAQMHSNVLPQPGYGQAYPMKVGGPANLHFNAGATRPTQSNASSATETPAPSSQASPTSSTSANTSSRASFQSTQETPLVSTPRNTNATNSVASSTATAPATMANSSSSQSPPSKQTRQAANQAQPHAQNSAGSTQNIADGTNSAASPHVNTNYPEYAFWQQQQQQQLQLQLQQHQQSQQSQGIQNQQSSVHSASSSVSNAASLPSYQQPHPMILQSQQQAQLTSQQAPQSAQLNQQAQSSIHANMQPHAQHQQQQQHLHAQLQYQQHMAAAAAAAAAAASNSRDASSLSGVSSYHNSQETGYHSQAALNYAQYQRLAPGVGQYGLRQNSSQISSGSPHAYPHAFNPNSSGSPYFASHIPNYNAASHVSGSGNSGSFSGASPTSSSAAQQQQLQQQQQHLQQQQALSYPQSSSTGQQMYQNSNAGPPGLVHPSMAGHYGSNTSSVPTGLNAYGAYAQGRGGSSGNAQMMNAHQQGHSSASQQHHPSLNTYGMHMGSISPEYAGMTHEQYRQFAAAQQHHQQSLQTPQSSHYHHQQLHPHHHHQQLSPHHHASSSSAGQNFQSPFQMHQAQNAHLQHQQQQYAAAIAANAALAAQHQQHQQHFKSAPRLGPAGTAAAAAAAAAQNAMMMMEDDDGEIIHSKALAKAESDQSKTKKKRKREGDDDDDEDFTGVEDNDWQPGNRRSSSTSKRKRRTSQQASSSGDWEPDSYFSGSTEHLGRSGSQNAFSSPQNPATTSQSPESELFVASRPRRERRATLKYREKIDSDDEDFEEELPRPRSSKASTGKSSSAKKASATAPSSSTMASPATNSNSSTKGSQALQHQSSNEHHSKQTDGTHLAAFAPQGAHQQAIQFTGPVPDLHSPPSLSSSTATHIGQPSASSSFSSTSSCGNTDAHGAQPSIFEASNTNPSSSSLGAVPTSSISSVSASNRSNVPSSSMNTSQAADEDDQNYGFEEDDAAGAMEMDEESDGATIDKVLDYREYVDETKLNPNAMNADGSLSSGYLKNATRTATRGVMTAETKMNKEYRIKWKGMSYMHCTWESYEALQAVKGVKKLDNYIKASIKEFEWRKTASREELELHDIEQEMLQDLYDEHLKVDRVIAYRKSSDSAPSNASQNNQETSSKASSNEIDENNNKRSSPEYLCVWSKLPYVEATWERAEDVAAYQKKIDKYLNRSQQQLMPRVFYGARMHRPSFREVQLLQSTPTEWLKGGTLRDYQLQGINWLVFSWCNSTNCILADEMGLGKTIQTLSFLGFLQFRQHIPGPFLIVVPLSTIANWEAESAKWLPDMNTVVYMGDSKSRELIREHEFWYRSNGKLMTKFNTLITSYEIILKDKQHLGSIKWNFLAVDEAHRLKNADSALHEVLNDFTTSSRLLITGTPLQNSLKELWALLNFLEPRYFPSLEQFEREYSRLEGEGQLAALHQRLKPHVLRRFKSQVEKSLPAKNERILRVGMAPIQRKYYRWIINRNFAELNRGLRGQEMRTLSNIVVELKKVCNHPFLFPNAEDQARTMAIQQALHLQETEQDQQRQQEMELLKASGKHPTEVDLKPKAADSAIVSPDTQKKINEAMLDTLIRSSGKLMLLDRLLLRLKETGHRVLIFSQMVRMLDLLSEYLRLRNFQFQRLDGSMSRSSRQMAMESFNAEGSKDFCFILSTRAGGLGINLATADTVIIFDSDWNPQNDLQAQSRAHRIGQKHVVNIYRLMAKNTVEEDILERAKRKLVLDHLVIQRMSTGKTPGAHSSSSSYVHSSSMGTGSSANLGGAGGNAAYGSQLGLASGSAASGGSGASSAAGMFSKGELADIIKFGAEDLFKNREDDQFDSDGNPIVNGSSKSQLLDDMDIDDILQRAEPAPEENQPGFELLSAFKVASFDTGTEEDDDKEDSGNSGHGASSGGSSGTSSGRRGRRSSKNSSSSANNNASGASTGNNVDDFWDRIIPSELRIDRVSASDMIVTGPRSRKKRLDISTSTGSEGQGESNKNLNYSDASVTASLASGAQSSSSNVTSAPSSTRPSRSTRKSRSSLISSSSSAIVSTQTTSNIASQSSSSMFGNDGDYLSPEEDDGESAGNEEGNARRGSIVSTRTASSTSATTSSTSTTSASAAKKKTRSRSDRKRTAVSDGEIDSVEVRKLLQTVRTYGCDDMEKVIQLSGLHQKWPGLVASTLNDILAQCRACIEEFSKNANSSSSSHAQPLSASAPSSSTSMLTNLSSSSSAPLTSAPNVPRELGAEQDLSENSLPRAASAPHGEQSELGPLSQRALSAPNQSTASSMDVDGTSPRDVSVNAPASGSTTIKYMDVLINAVQLLTRLSDLSDLAALVKQYADPYAFRLEVLVKNWALFPTLWSSPIDDARLLLGAHLYGFGQWTKLVQDEKLGLEGKLFGSGQPTSAQLNTRAESLLKTLRDAKASSKLGSQLSGSTNPMTDIADLEMPTRRKRSASAASSSSTLQSSLSTSSSIGSSTSSAGQGGAKMSSSVQSILSSSSESTAIAQNQPQTSSSSTSKNTSKPKAPSKSKPKRRGANSDSQSEISAPSEAMMELSAVEESLAAEVASLWAPLLPALAASYRALTKIPASNEAKVSQFRQFLSGLREHVLSLAEYSTSSVSEEALQLGSDSSEEEIARLKFERSQSLISALWSYAAVHICASSRTGAWLQQTTDQLALAVAQGNVMRERNSSEYDSGSHAEHSEMPLDDSNRYALLEQQTSAMDVDDAHRGPEETDLVESQLLSDNNDLHSHRDMFMTLHHEQQLSHHFDRHPDHELSGLDESVEEFDPNQVSAAIVAVSSGSKDSIGRVEPEKIQERDQEVEQRVEEGHILDSGLVEEHVDPTPIHKETNVNAMEESIGEDVAKEHEKEKIEEEVGSDQGASKMDQVTSENVDNIDKNTEVTERGQQTDQTRQEEEDEEKISEEDNAPEPMEVVVESEELETKEEEVPKDRLEELSSIDEKEIEATENENSNHDAPSRLDDPILLQKDEETKVAPENDAMVVVEEAAPALNLENEQNSPIPAPLASEPQSPSEEMISPKMIEEKEEEEGDIKTLKDSGAVPLPDDSEEAAAASAAAADIRKEDVEDDIAGDSVVEDVSDAKLSD